MQSLDQLKSTKKHVQCTFTQLKCLVSLQSFTDIDCRCVHTFYVINVSNVTMLCRALILMKKKTKLTKCEIHLYLNLLYVLHHTVPHFRNITGSTGVLQ